MKLMTTTQVSFMLRQPDDLANGSDVASMTRPSMSESIGRESMDLPPSGISSTGERIPNKKKGIKGLFKRKDKDAKVV